MDAQELPRAGVLYPHEFEGAGSLLKCVHCGSWFHNEADADEMHQECDVRLRAEEEA